MEAGIDEAGRGPVMGPLVVAGVAHANPDELWRIGCRDSKLLSAAQRTRLTRMIKDLPGVQWKVVVVEPAQLDARMANASLNEIEADVFTDIARALGAPRVVVDAADVDAARFGRRIAAGLPDGVNVVSEHKADKNHATVAAGSILAKTARDESIAALAKRLERRLPMALGSGYPSDPLTVSFLSAWLTRFGELPEGTRRAWKTSQRLLEGQKVRSLADFDETAV